MKTLIMFFLLTSLLIAQTTGTKQSLGNFDFYNINNYKTGESIQGTGYRVGSHYYGDLNSSNGTQYNYSEYSIGNYNYFELKSSENNKVLQEFR